MSYSETILAHLPQAVFVLDAKNYLVHVNPAAENLMQMSASLLIGQNLNQILPDDSPLFDLIHHIRQQGGQLVERDIILDSLRTGKLSTDIYVTDLPDGSNDESCDESQAGIAEIMLTVEPHYHHHLETSYSYKRTVRAVTGMSQLLLHEIKNPLSGIRGAAQLVEQSLSHQADQQLTQMICHETDRIVSLIDKFNDFSENTSFRSEPINIHIILDHVRRLAENGFAKHVRFIEKYDPSLPDVLGDNDRLIQVILNLIKNASEAIDHGDGEIVITTSYQQGVRFRVSGHGQAHIREKLSLPICISIKDNGIGIPEDVRPHIFDPFVSNKPGGSGLGLPLVAKIIEELGGAIDFHPLSRGTEFRLFLPLHKNKKTEALG